MTTVVDVARHAGVSLATVSRVLNGTASVSAEMRERVQHAVQTLDFRPNAMARGLRKGQANAVALLVGDIAQRHFAELTMRVQVALEQAGLDLLLFNLGHSESRLTTFLTRAESMRLRGVVVALSDHVPRAAASLLATLQDRGMRIVSVGQNLTRHRISSIVHEERAATKRSIEYLLARGHRRVAYVGRIAGSAIGSERFRGYKQALDDAGAFDETLVFDMAYRYSAGHDALLRALDDRLDFTAVQAGSDEIATGAMAALHDRGLSVPADMAIVGFGDVEMGSYLRPALTTLSTHPELAAEHLSQLLANPADSTARLVVLERSLVVRESA